ncbi:MAG: DUF1292 domain-containing protein [Lachnospiraceae bacterium]|nr:DUF1292 domain-containing protein [Lachnospiraceae bacterium]
MNEELYEDLGTVTLTLDNDEELECEILAIYPAGEHQYIALQPMTDDDGIDEENIFIYRYIYKGEDVDAELENIEDDDEYELAVDAFDEILDSDLFDAEEE